MQNKFTSVQPQWPGLPPTSKGTSNQDGALETGFGALDGI